VAEIAARTRRTDFASAFVIVRAEPSRRIRRARDRSKLGIDGDARWPSSPPRRGPASRAHPTSRSAARAPALTLSPWPHAPAPRSENHASW